MAGKESDRRDRVEGRRWGLGRKAEVRPVGPCSHIMEFIVPSCLQRLLNHYVLNENEHRRQNIT